MTEIVKTNIYETGVVCYNKQRQCLPMETVSNVMEITSQQLCLRNSADLSFGKISNIFVSSHRLLVLEE